MTTSINRSFCLIALFLAIGCPTFAQLGKPLYTISVTRGGAPLGVIMVEMFPDIAPKHVANFDSLAGIGFFDGTAFHRVVPGFVIQGGDPNTRSGDESTWGTGDPSQQTVPAEFSKLSHQRGIFSAARSDDPNSATSQFFICVAAAPGLDKRYSIYGRVIAGMEIADTIVRSPVKSGTEIPQQKIAMVVARTGTDTTTPAITELRTPSDDTMNVTATQQVRWGAVEGAILYEVQLSSDPDFSTLAFKDSVLSTSAIFKNLVRGSNKYHWRVRALNGGKRGPFSVSRSFTTAPLATSVEDDDGGSSEPKKLDLSDNHPLPYRHQR
ncbi:MAG: peptidylprolyl isomerase [Armatimonadetes bacterium]|nr:peptidylprolyl isomerase [Armatimonadota bacterium]